MVMRNLALGTVSLCACVFAALMVPSPVEAAADEVNACPLRAPDNGMVGYVDTNGYWVVSPQYTKAYGFSEGVAEVEVSGKRGFIDVHGKFVIPPEIEGTRGNFSEGLLSVSQGGKEGFISNTGKFVISPKFDMASPFQEGLSSVKIGGKAGYINKSGDIIIPAQFDYASDFVNGLAIVEKNRKYGIISKSGVFVIQFNYDNIYRFTEGLAGVKRDGKYGFIDASGHEIIKIQYDNVDPFSEGMALVQKNGKYGYIDRMGNEVIPFKFDYAQKFSDGLAPVSFKGKYGYVDKSGTTVIPPKFDFAYTFFKGIAIVVNKKDGKELYGLVLKNGEVVVEPQYEESLMYDRPCRNGLFAFWKKKNGGPLVIFDTKGKRVTEFDRQELVRNPDYSKFQNAVAGDDPQKMYLAAGAFSRNGEESKARQIYEAIIEQFPESAFAVKANDQLMAAVRSSETRSAADRINSDAKWRNYQTCKEEMNSCYSRTSGKGQCYRDCDSLIR